MDSQAEYIQSLDKSLVMEFGEESDLGSVLDDQNDFPLTTPPQTTDEKLDELLSILRPLAPVLAALPDLMTKVDPLLEGLRTSPVLKMMGVKF